MSQRGIYLFTFTREQVGMRYAIIELDGDALTPMVAATGVVPPIEAPYKTVTVVKSLLPANYGAHAPYDGPVVPVAPFNVTET